MSDRAWQFVADLAVYMFETHRRIVYLRSAR